MFGENLKKWREMRGLTQTQLAELAGSAQAVVARIESGKMSPSEDVMNKFAKALNIPLILLVDDRASGPVYALDELYKDDPELAAILAKPENKTYVGFLKDITEAKLDPDDLSALLKLIRKYK